MKIINSIKQFMSRVFSFKTKGTIGVSFDDKITIKKLPINSLIQKGKFVQFNKELIHFEVTMVDIKNKKVKVCEICTDNEFELSFDFFEYLFQETPVPAECKF